MPGPDKIERTVLADKHLNCCEGCLIDNGASPNGGILKLGLDHSDDVGQTRKPD